MSSSLAFQSATHAYRMQSRKKRCHSTYVNRVLCEMTTVSNETYNFAIAFRINVIWDKTTHTHTHTHFSKYLKHTYIVPIAYIHLTNHTARTWTTKPKPTKCKQQQTIKIVLLKAVDIVHVHIKLDSICLSAYPFLYISSLKSRQQQQQKTNRRKNSFTLLPQ